MLKRLLQRHVALQVNGKATRMVVRTRRSVHRIRKYLEIIQRPYKHPGNFVLPFLPMHRK